jgi:uncharacterized protein (DUF2062 family)
MMSRWMTVSRNQVAGWLRTGDSPERLALTLALGFAIGCLPVIGIPSALCIGLAIALRLNVPAIQAANCLAMPLQLTLILPFVRLGGKLFASGGQQSLERALLHGSPMQMLQASGSAASQAVAGWFVIAGPMFVVMTLALTAVFQRVPALATARNSRS